MTLMPWDMLPKYIVENKEKGYVNIAILPFIQTQRQLNYLSDRKIAFDLC